MIRGTPDGRVAWTHNTAAASFKLNRDCYGGFISIAGKRLSGDRIGVANASAQPRRMGAPAGLSTTNS